jgi:hypothetical protein
LGRWYENKLHQTRLQSSPAINKQGYNRHRAVGNLLSRIHGMDAFGNHSVQRLVDELGRGPFMVPIRCGLFVSDISVMDYNFGFL